MHPNDRGQQSVSSSELAAIRRKKNADAQAAFRKRRASYISSLESTVHGLEQIIRNLQESIEQCNNTERDLRRQNVQLRYDLDHALRRVGSGQSPPRSADSSHGPQQWAPAAQQPYGAPVPATPPLSSANGSTSPPASSVVSAASVGAPTSPFIQTAVAPGGSNGASTYLSEDHPVNLLSRPVNMYRDPKTPVAAGGGLYTFPQRPNEAGWVDSPVQAQQSPSMTSFAYPPGDSPIQHEAQPARSMPLSLSMPMDNGHRTAYSSASVSPTTTDSGSPYVTRGPGSMSAFGGPPLSSGHGMDSASAFRNYFHQAAGGGDHSTSLAGISHMRTDPSQAGPSTPTHIPPPLGPRMDVASIAPPPMHRDDDLDEDILDDEDRVSDDPIVSQTLAVLKSHAFGGSRKPRVRSIRGVQRHDSGRSSPRRE